MFTGIIEELGTVQAIQSPKNLLVLNVRAPRIFVGTRPGDSISVNGVCLTVAKMVKPGVFVFELMRETMDTTNLQSLKKGSRVNLERALKAGSRLGGHFVTGHIDGVGRIVKILKKKNFVEWQISFKDQTHWNRYLVPKGSIALDGVSLTVGEVKQNLFTVYLIPYTLKVTTFGHKKISDGINIEIDLLTKYVLKILK